MKLNILFLSIGALAASGTSPSVTTNDGTIIGTTDGNIENFKGIPFAEPPIGNLRLKPPVSLSKPFGTINSEPTPTSCPQFLFSVNSTTLPLNILAKLLDTPLFQAASKAGEDCLTLNVQRPAGTTSNSKLPVLFWIYGGGFDLGTTQTYDASNVLSKSVSLGKPIIAVAANYRVGGFGFLAGDDLTKEGSTNIGLRDQRFALQWVQDNIAAFGGDPSKVTIFGNSAGSISVFDQTIINGGDNTYKGKQLFQGAIMNSGSVLPAVETTSDTAQTVYNKVVQNAGCSSVQGDKLPCLRALNYTAFLNAVNSVPSLIDYQRLALTYLPRPDPGSNFFSQSPELALFNGKYTKVPIIIGDQEDEGTAFSIVQTQLTTTDDLVAYIKTYFPLASYEEVAGLVATYPNDPSAGSPFGTGPFYNLYPQYKRLAALLGDAVFTLTRRAYLDNVTSTIPAWSYLASYLHGTPFLGTFHGSDYVQIYSNTPSPIAAATIQTYYISFINFLDPNKLSKSLIAWPRWNAKTPQLINFRAFDSQLIPDTFRQKSYEYLVAHAQHFRI